MVSALIFRIYQFGFIALLATQIAGQPVLGLQVGGSTIRAAVFGIRWP